MDQAPDITNPMSRTERRASFSLAAIFALRMLGLFMILPVFSLFAERLEDNTPLLMGIALSIYGLTQALFQIPFGLLSDRYGRKAIITLGLLLFAAGSVVAALSESIYGIILGRALQGSGAIAAAVMALAADLTREEHRTKAMALIGISIGISFTISMVAGPILAGLVGVQGIFWLTAILALLGIGVLFLLVPHPAHTRFHSDAEAVRGRFKDVLLDADLLRLDFSILVLHLILTASFVVLPLALRDTGLAKADHWHVYLPVLVISMVAAVPFIIIAEKKRKMKSVFLGAVTAIGLADLGLFGYHAGVTEIAVFLFVFFCGFNLLEATLPSLISKMAPVALKGTAMGIYSTSQFFGAFLGGAAGGWIYGAFGIGYVFLFCVGAALVWLGVASGMEPPRHLSSLLFAVGSLEEDEAALLTKEILQVEGVAEAVVVVSDGVAYVKVDGDRLDRDRLHAIVPQAAQA